jgi:hypothetical protein
MAGRLKQIFGGVIRSLHQLWLEITGTFLVLIGLSMAFHVVKAYRNHRSDDGTGIWSTVGMGLFSALILAFGIHSFWKSRNLH